MNNKNLITTLHDVCVSLSKQSNKEQLLEKIIYAVQLATHADGATLYIKNQRLLKFHIVKNNSLNMSLTYSSAAIRSLPAINLDPAAHHISISSICANEKRVVLVQDAEREAGIDLTATKEFDKKFHYTTKSILALPIINKHHRLLGVIQLINPQDQSNQACEFTDEMIGFCEAMAALASLALS